MPVSQGFKSLSEFREVFGNQGVILDLRLKEVRERHRIPFALEFDVINDFNLIAYIKTLSKNKSILILASERQHSKSVYRILTDLGFKGTYQLCHHV